MQTQPQVPDPASIWWGPLFRAAAEPVQRFPVWRPRARVGLGVSAFLISLVFPPLAPIAWWLARAELQRIECGDCTSHGKTALDIAMVGSMLVTTLLVVALLFIL